MTELGKKDGIGQIKKNQKDVAEGPQMLLGLKAKMRLLPSGRRVRGSGLGGMHRGLKLY